jgi:cell division protein FtsI (penicillin-binding protein 3)
LQPVKRWGGSSIGSIAIGQEVAVTPLQLVTMVSTIANGGEYLPPHVLLTDADSDSNKPAQAVPFKHGGDLPNPLPTGAHRVIATLTAAQMRKMMEGVVLFGTGKSAQLNGYSSGGKTGTAQKIDPATHTYSKTMHIASFAGFAPVNNPVIAVAIVMDSPKGAYYGADVSAPVFADVAQQVLEYLGVPHDIDLRPAAATKPSAPITEDDSAQDESAVRALYDAVNDLPSDDPLRTPPQKSVAAAQQPADSAENAKQPSQAISTTQVNAMQSHEATPQTNSAQNATQTVTVSDGTRLRVPSLLGLPVRKVIEQAAAAGLEVQIVGNGTARQQAPDPGTMVAPGTKIVVRCKE